MATGLEEETVVNEMLLTPSVVCCLVGETPPNKESPITPGSYRTPLKKEKGHSRQEDQRERRHRDIKASLSHPRPSFNQQGI